jgi:hypothetical protein
MLNLVVRKVTARLQKVNESLETRDSQYANVISVSTARTGIYLLLKRFNTLPTSISKAPLNRHPSLQTASVFIQH